MSGTTYQPQYRLHGTAPWTNFGSPISGLSVTVTGLVAGTQYDFQVVATPAAGSVIDSNVVGDTTVALATPVRDTSRFPGADGRYFALPLQTTANWITSGSLVTSLRGLPPDVNYVDNFGVPWVTGSAGDPDVTITDGTNSIIAKVPAGTVMENSNNPSSSTDHGLGGADRTRPYLGWCANGNVLIDGAYSNAIKAGSTISCTGLLVYDTTGPVLEDAVTKLPSTAGSDNAVGSAFLESDLQSALSDPNYSPPHTMQCALDASQIGPTTVWPVVFTDSSLTGPIPEGVTLGIPSTTKRPTGQSRGFYLLWDSLQRFGWLVYNVTGGGLRVSSYATSQATQSLVTDMRNSIAAVLPSVCILAYDGSNGSQTGPSTAKGMINGQRSDAFPAPPLVDLSQTGGKHVLPSTFGAWYATGGGNFYNTIGGTP